MSNNNKSIDDRIRTGDLNVMKWFVLIPALVQLACLGFMALTIFIIGVVI